MFLTLLVSVLCCIWKMLGIEYGRIAVLMEYAYFVIHWLSYYIQCVLIIYGHCMCLCNVRGWSIINCKIPWPLN